MSMHKGLIGKTDGGASVKNLQNSEQATALMKQDVTLKDYIERKTDNRGELGNYPFPLDKLGYKEIPKDYSKDFDWVKEFIDNKDGVLPLTAHVIRDALHIQGHGSALVLLPSGKWFMTDTSGG